MPISLQELQLVSLPSSFAYRYGDRSYFASELNVMAKHFFAKFRTNNGYLWSRVIEVVEDLDSVYMWSKKAFHVKLRLEGIGNLVPLHALSTKPVELADVTAYLARRPQAKREPMEAVVPESGTAAPEESMNPITEDEGERKAEAVLAAAESQLPNSATIAAFAKLVNERIVTRRLSNEDHAAEIVLRSELKDRSEGGSGNIAIRHTVMQLKNLQAETQSGIATSFHPTGISARAMQRRAGDHLDASSSQHAAVSFDTTSPSQLSFFSQPSFASVASQEGGTQSQSVAVESSPRTPLPLSQRSLTDSSALWASASSATMDEDALLSSRQKALEDEQRFARYIAIPERSSFNERLAQISFLNKSENAKTRSKAEMHERMLNRKGNIVESGGLWITDDDERRRMAQWHAEEERKRHEGEDGSAKKKDDKPKATSKEAAGGANPSATTAAATVVLTEEEKFLRKCFEAASESQSLSSQDCIGDDFLEDLPQYLNEVRQSLSASPAPVAPRGGEEPRSALLMGRSLSLSQRAMSIELRSERAKRQRE